MKAAMLGQWIGERGVTELVRAARQNSVPTLKFDGPEFRRCYNQSGFTFEHSLSEHPLFRLGPLADLCRRRRDLVLHRGGPVAVDADFDRAFDPYSFPEALDAALQRIGEPGSYFMISNAEKDSLYRPVIEGLLGEIAAQSTALDPGLNWWSSYVFISTDASVTPYHMDREMNFLIQVHGAKRERLWDANVMTQREKEVLFGNLAAPRPAYTPALEQLAKVYELTPGVGVHHPFIAPHVVETQSSLSISLAITYRTDGSERCSDAFRYNYRMRQLGLRPRPVGAHLLEDKLRAGSFRLAKGAYKLARRGLRAREWLSRSMIAVEAPGWRGATKAHTARM
jgi:hypothetical protein